MDRPKLVTLIPVASRLPFRIFIEHTKPSGTALKKCCPPRQKSRVERLKETVEPLLTKVRVENSLVFLQEEAARGGGRDPMTLNPHPHTLHPRP